MPLAVSGENALACNIMQLHGMHLPVVALDALQHSSSRSSTCTGDRFR